MFESALAGLRALLLNGEYAAVAHRKKCWHISDLRRKLNKEDKQSYEKIVRLKMPLSLLV